MCGSVPVVENLRFQVHGVTPPCDLLQGVITKCTAEFSEVNASTGLQNCRGLDPRKEEP